MTDIERLRQLTALNDLDASRALLRHAQRTSDTTLQCEALRSLVLGGAEAYLHSRHGDWPYQGGMRTNGGNHLAFDTRLPELLIAARGEISHLVFDDAVTPVEWTRAKHHALNHFIALDVIDRALECKNMTADPERVRVWVGIYRKWVAEISTPFRDNEKTNEWVSRRPLDHSSILFPQWISRVLAWVFSDHGPRMVSQRVLTCLPNACAGLSEYSDSDAWAISEGFHARGKNELLRLLFVTPDEE